MKIFILDGGIMCKGNQKQTKAERLFEERIDKKHIRELRTC